MAKDINNPWVGSILQRAFQLQGRVQPRLEEFIIPTVSIGDLSEGSPVPITRAASAARFEAAVAAQSATMRFEMPPTTIALITRVIVIVAVQTNMRVSFSSTGAAQANTALKSFVDGRLLNVNEEPAGVLTTGTQAAAISPIAGVFAVPITGFAYQPRHWVVGSGNNVDFGFVEFQLQATNLAATLGLEWVEFQLP